MPRRTSSPKSLTFTSLPKNLQSIARWIRDLFLSTGKWPSQAAVARLCFVRRISLRAIKEAQHDVFGSDLGSPPNSEYWVTLRPWVMRDLGGFEKAFDTAYSRYRKAIQALTKGPATSVPISNDDVDGDPLLKAHVGYLLSTRLGGGSDKDGKWVCHVGMHDLVYPLQSIDEWLVQRPTLRVPDSIGVSGSSPKAQRASRISMFSDLDVVTPKATPWVFISSTFSDLEKHRHLALDAALKQKFLPVGMELWSASPEVPLKVCLDELVQADLMLVIIGARYGSETPDGRSFTEAEYEFAKEHDIPVCSFLPSPRQLWSPEQIEPDPARKRLERFKERLRLEGKPAYYDSPEDLRSNIIHTLGVIRAKHGW